MPSPKKLQIFICQEAKVRVDSHAYTGYEIPTHYDSMIGNLLFMQKIEIAL